MEAMENILTRRSVRVYKDQPVSRETLDTVLAAAQMAPTWKNTQTPGYIVITTPEKKAELMEALPAYNARNVSTAPVVVVMTTKKKRCAYERDGSFTTKKEDRWEMFDAGIATQTFCLAAHEQGVGSVIMGIFDETKIAEVIDVPEGQQVAALIAIGYPVFEPEAPKRKEVSELLSFQ